MIFPLNAFTYREVYFKSSTRFGNADLRKGKHYVMSTVVKWEDFFVPSKGAISWRDFLADSKK